MKDNKGREYAKLSQLKDGDHIELDDGFDCHAAGRVTVHTNDDGELYFACREGKHFLIGQLEGDDLVGIYSCSEASQPPNPLQG